jgi:hypothetical protein
MLTDYNCIYDLMDATFAKGHSVSDLSYGQIYQLLRKVEELLTASKFESQLGCGIEVVNQILLA